MHIHSGGTINSTDSAAASAANTFSGHASKVLTSTVIKQKILFNFKTSLPVKYLHLMMCLNQLSKTPTNNTPFTGKCREQIYSFYFLAKSIHYTQFFYKSFFKNSISSFNSFPASVSPTITRCFSVSTTVVVEIISALFSSAFSTLSNG